MTTYIRRAAKYALYLFVLLGIIFLIMNSFRSVDQGSLFTVIASTSRGLVMLVLVLVFAAIHPLMGYVKRTLTFDASQQVDQVVNVMSLCGYIRTDSGSSDKMTFRGATKGKRIILFGEDQIEISTKEGLSTISGPRKEVVRATFRFTTFIG